MMMKPCFEVRGRGVWARVRALAAILAAGAICLGSATAYGAAPPTKRAVIEHYAELAHAAFTDSLDTATALKEAIDRLVAKPSPAAHKAAKQAWLAARSPYGQTEVFRFGNPNVDEWEGQVNAWPLDEGLIDYVASDYEPEEGNPHASANLIAGAEPITPELLRGYHEKGGFDANVASGYHAIEFLLWGQDLNEKSTDAGLRPYTDFVGGPGCTHGNCGRRGRYLEVATALLVSDLRDMAADWAPGNDGNYRAALLKADADDGLQKIFFGMGSLSLGELAGERMNVALLANAQEDEHSCFSDNTHADIKENARGIQNVYLGIYVRPDGTRLVGPGLGALVASLAPDHDAAMRRRLEETMARVLAISAATYRGEPFDQQIQTHNAEGNRRVRAAIDALKAQTRAIEEAARVLGVKDLKPETSDSFTSG